MMKLEVQGFTLICEELEKNSQKLVVKEYEGSGAVLDLSSYTQIVRIGKKAFLSCKTMKKVILPESIEWIEDWAFSRCSNLQSINIEKTFETCIWGKGALDGCTNLTHVSFANFSEHTSSLLALNCNRMLNDHLLRSEDIGEPMWFTKWDMALLSRLQEQETEEEEKNNCFLCLKRLKNNSCLGEAARQEIRSYIQDRSFASRRPVVWDVLKEEFIEELDYFALYLDIVKPSKEVLQNMLGDVNATQMQLKAFLINETSKPDQEDSFLDSLFL